MLIFTGASLLNLDPKGRFAVPTRHREAVLAQGGAALVMTCNHEGGLLVFPQKTWEVFSAQLVRLPMELQWRKRLYIGHAQPVEMDTVGRVLISPELRDMAEIDTEIKLMGMGDYFELWQPAKQMAKQALDIARNVSAQTSEAFKDFAF